LVARAPSAIFRPALLANEGHEGHAADVLFLEFGPTSTSDSQQGLLPFLRADRNNEPAANSQLLLQCLRDFGSTRRHENGIEWRGLGPA
jgi:hypothetical protein